MKNKTCGDCRYFDKEWCAYHRECVVGNDESVTKRCKAFEECQKPTNGDVIRQGGNRDFAEYFVYETGAVFASTLIVDKTFDTYEEATKATEDYLNAPAESEGKDE